MSLLKIEIKIKIKKKILCLCYVKSLSLSVCLSLLQMVYSTVCQISFIGPITHKTIVVWLFVCLYPPPTAVPIHIVRKYNRVASSMTSGLIPTEFSAWFVYSILLIIGSFSYIDQLLWFRLKLTMTRAIMMKIMVLMMIMTNSSKAHSKKGNKYVVVTESNIDVSCH